MTQRLDSFAKIINLMENASTEGEAQAAAAAFRRLLIKENITEDEVRNRLEGVQEAEYIHEIVSVTDHGQWYQLQYSNMLDVIARSNLCFFAMLGDSSRCGVIAGRRKNVDAVLSIFQAFKTSAKIRANQAKQQAPRSMRSQFTESFLAGAVTGLRTKYYLEQQRDSASETALVLAESENSKDVLAAIFGSVQPGKRTRARDTNGYAYDKGVQYGLTYGPEELNG